jgi:hypothetical protein
VADVIFLLVVVAFFAIAVLAIRACELVAESASGVGEDGEP